MNWTTEGVYLTFLRGCSIQEGGHIARVRYFFVEKKSICETIPLINYSNSYMFYVQVLKQRSQIATL